MRILAVADEQAKKYYDYYQPGSLDEFDLSLACGDLSKSYLEFLVTMAGCPLLYVRGNHDDQLIISPPEGCICIEDRIYEYQGVRFLGLGGCLRYRPDGANMYTEREMKRRIRRLGFQLWRKKGFDVLVTHAAAYGCGDLDTHVHRGFNCFLDLIDRWHPACMVHGHVHRNYGQDFAAVRQYQDTRIINACGYQVLEI
ncbi:MAG: metallophosphoesterase [Eubacterium sp.]|nr:metallophosphoesterase [Eubacterium sp.]